MSTAAADDGARDAGSKVPELLLASSSPRRRRLLDAADLPHLAVPPSLDDSDASREIGRSIAERTISLAWLKAAATAGDLHRRGHRRGLLLAADTLVADGDRALGKPATTADAEAMLRSLEGRTHSVWTGHALVDLASGNRRLWAEAARVRLGEIGEVRMRRHLELGRWQGRAGGYSLDEIADAGWEVECAGDPEVVLGLSTTSVRHAIASIAGGAMS